MQRHIVNSTIMRRARLTVLFIPLALAGCGGSIFHGCLLCGPFADNLSGSVSGLVGSGLTLQDNSTPLRQLDGPAANGTNVLFGIVNFNTGYNVTVKTQPTNPSQTCVVANGMGTSATSDVTNIAVTCTTNTYTVGGTVIGLTGLGLVLRDNGGDNLNVSTDGSFNFATAVASGATYRVTEFAQPTNPVQNCTVNNGTGSGELLNSNITTVAVVCVNVGRFAYAADSGDSTISAYTIDLTTGALTPVVGSPMVTRYNPNALAADPAGTFLYAVDSGGISVYSINATTGVLSAVAGSPFQTDAGPYSIFIHPSGRFAYTANVQSMSVSAYAINPATRALTAVLGSPFAAGSNPVSVTGDPSGKFLYVTDVNGSANNISSYAIDTTSGALTAIAGSPFSAGGGPESVAVDPSGKFAYVANNISNDVSAFTINATTGALTAIAGTPFAAGLNPSSVTVDPSGTFLFVANANAMGNAGASTVSAYTINPTTGALTAVTGSPFAADMFPDSVAVDPSGKFVYVTNGDPPANSISAYIIDASTGALLPAAGSPFAAGHNPRSITVVK